MTYALLAATIALTSVKTYVTYMFSNTLADNANVKNTDAINTNAMSRFRQVTFCSFEIQRNV